MVVDKTRQDEFVEYFEAIKTMEKYLRVENPVFQFLNRRKPWNLEGFELGDLYPLRIGLKDLSSAARIVGRKSNMMLPIDYSLKNGGFIRKLADSATFEAERILNELPLITKSDPPYSSGFF